MKVCVLADPLWGDEPFDPGYYLQGHDYEVHNLRRPHVFETLKDLAGRGYDVFLNMCDGAADEDRPGLDTVQALETLNVPFTGADSGFYEPTREQMKQACRRQGVRTPSGVAVGGVHEIAASLDGMHYPMIVKHPNSYASVGLVPESRVEDPEHLRQQVERVVGLFGHALIEEFIDGREFSVLVQENPDNPERPVAYAPVEFIFPPGAFFKFEDLKWARFAEMTCVPVVDEDIVYGLKDIARRVFVGLDGVGYGRCDIRMNRRGELYVLEINPNGAVFYPPDQPGAADFILQYDPEGHRAFVDRLLRAGIARHRRRNGLA